MAEIGAKFVVSTTDIVQYNQRHDKRVNITTATFKPEDVQGGVESEHGQVDATDGPKFDRILVCSFMGHIGGPYQEMLFDIVDLLKSRAENPHATILSLLPWATESGFLSIKGGLSYSSYLTRLLPTRWHVYTGKAHNKAIEQGYKSVNDMRRAELDIMERRDKEYFDMYKKELRIEEVVDVSGLELVDVDKMTIAPAYPYRLKMTGTEEEQEDKFSLRLTSLMKGGERVVEFRRVPNPHPQPPSQEFIELCAMSMLRLLLS